MQEVITHLHTDGSVSTRNDDDSITITPSSFVQRYDAEPLVGEPRKLNIGAGDCPLPGYDNIDRKTGHEAYPLAYDDESFDEIRASHLLEHFPYEQTLDVVKDWVGKLKPGGLLKIAVPDFEKIVNLTVQGAPLNVQGYIMGGHTDEDDHHGAIFDVGTLSEIMGKAGLEDVRFWAGDESDTSSDPISLNMCGYKPVAQRGTLEFKGVTFILPTPRFGPSDHHRCIYDALAAFGARVRTVAGCFWNQHLSEAMREEVALPECRYIVTLDYDSIFGVEDVAQMYRIMETHPHIDALVPVQSHRGTDGPLFTMQEKDGTQSQYVPQEKFDGLTAEIATGHFGLTFIRAEALREFPLPWMVPQLAPDNTWGEGHVDADIDFWNKWRAEGNKVHLANHVVIGHLQDMIMWPTNDFTPVYQRVTDYHKHGKPPEAKQ